MEAIVANRLAYLAIAITYFQADTWDAKSSDRRRTQCTYVSKKSTKRGPRAKQHRYCYWTSQANTITTPADAYYKTSGNAKSACQ
jgi:hypothetical protein